MTHARTDAERDALRSRIEAHLRAATGHEVEVQRLEPLAGGACQENWRVELAGTPGEPSAAVTYVLRADSSTALPLSISRAAEARVIHAAVQAGVRTPEALWGATGLTRDGATSYFLPWVPGEAIGRRVVKSPQLADARAKLCDELAHELARIHSITPERAPELFDQPPPRDVTAEVIALVNKWLDERPAPRPGLELAARWLDDHRPRSTEIVLVHGDFRVGNFMVAPEGLQAVLDWEFAHWGVPAQDLSWICVRDWRFGRLELPVGGVGRRDDFLRAYERESGRVVDRDEVRWWEIFGNVSWALGSLQQGDRYRAGDHDLELIAVARRAEEMEWEALRLIEKGVIA